MASDDHYQKDICTNEVHICSFICIFEDTCIKSLAGSSTVIDPLVTVLQAFNDYISSISFIREIQGHVLVQCDAAGPPTNQYFS